MSAQPPKGSFLLGALFAGLFFLLMYVAGQYGHASASLGDDEHQRLPQAPDGIACQWLAAEKPSVACDPQKGICIVCMEVRTEWAQYVDCKQVRPERCD